MGQEVSDLVAPSVLEDTDGGRVYVLMIPSVGRADGARLYVIWPVVPHTS